MILLPAHLIQPPVVPGQAVKAARSGNFSFCPLNAIKAVTSSHRHPYSSRVRCSGLSETMSFQQLETSRQGH